MVLARLTLMMAGAAAAKDLQKWDWNIGVIYKRNNAASTAAKDAVKVGLCARFGISPCEVTDKKHGKDEIYLSADLDVHVPGSKFSDVMLWLQLQRSSKVNGAGYDLDLLASPDLSSEDWPPGKTPEDLAVYAGFPSPLDTNRFPAPGVAAKPSRAELSYVTCGNKCDQANSGCAHSCQDLVHKLNYSCSEYYAPGKNYAGWCDETCGYGGCADDAWATSCSSDATCYAPYVNNTGCTGDDNVTSMHFHFYYVPNSAKSLAAINAFTAKATVDLSLAVDTCPDNYGHEQPHNITCWLTGPGGSGPLPAPPQWTQDHGGSSFDFSTFSMYVLREDLPVILPYVLATKPADLDFLVHPNTGCSYADHVDWGLHATKYTVANRYGTAEEGGWEDETNAPPNDVDSAAWAAAHLAADAAAGCAEIPSLDGAVGYSGFEIHFVYDPTPGTPGQAKAKAIVDALATEFKAKVDVGEVSPTAPQLDAYADPTSPFLAAHTNVKLVGGAPTLGAVLPWALAARAAHAAADVDVVLAPRGPSSGRDPACGPGDYVARSLYAGRRWQFNEAMGGHPRVEAEALDAARADARGLDVGAVASNFALYLLSAPNNAYQQAALSEVTRDLKELFNTTDCGGDAPFLEPKGLDGRLCGLGTASAPYKDDAEAMLVSYTALHVPADRLAEVLSATMALKAAAANGFYNVDVLLAPLTGSPATDYTTAALKGGSDWRINEDAL